MTDTTAPRSAFSYRAFTMFWIGRIVSILSFQMLVVAIGWQLYTLTGSALDLGFLGIAQFIPTVVLTPLVGHVADRYDHRRVLLLCRVGEASAAAILAIGTVMGVVDPLIIYIVIALVGAGRAFEIATMVAIIPGLVPRPVVPSATAWFASSNQIGLIVGPILGGVLYELGPGTVYGLAVAFWFIGASFIFLIHMEAVPRASEPVSVQSLLGGFDFVWRDRVILGTISLDMCAVFLSAAPVLFPIFARDILETGPWGLGLLRAAPGVGAFVMSIVLARRPLTLPIGKVLFTVVGIFGVAIIVFALSTHLILSLLALAVMGAADVVSVVIRFALVQLRTPAEMRGRVSAVNGMFTGTSNYLGDFRAGAVAAAIGAVPAVLIGGICVFAVAGLWMFLFPQLWRTRTYDELSAAEVLSGDKDKPS
ncbi:MAG: MFS transporter [Xanthobacteraceae bacterium]|nr:MFS transporter [Xanthobacteraceae bacterium]